MYKKEKFIKNITINKVFRIACKKYPHEVFLAYPSVNVDENQKSFSFNQVRIISENHKKFFKNIGLSKGDRVGLMIGNVPDFFILKLALNVLGVSCVPINSELSSREINYLLKHSNSKILITIKRFLNITSKIDCIASKKIILGVYKEHSIEIISKKKVIRSKKKKQTLRVFGNTEASLLYTSGTTGNPKGCILTHEYEINAGLNYINKGGFISFKQKKEKIYNCLPVHHVNSGVLSFFAVLITGNCQIQASRFSANKFWKEIKYSNATIFHYLGVMVPILLKQKKTLLEKQHTLRLGIGAGIEPNLHKIFESRFKVPMIELWGMTEMVRCIFDNEKDREVGKRCIGSPKRIIEAMVVNNTGKKVINKPGELLIRYSKDYPRRGFFSGYYKNNAATNKIWKNNWFHTGDLVIQKRSSKIYFIDRIKNIIRRTGENISAVEVESILLNDNSIHNCAVISHRHSIYEEEVFAFVVLAKGIKPNREKAESILEKARLNLAYFKLPGYIQFCSKLPTTSTQKIKKDILINSLKSENKLKTYDLCDFKKKIR